jgi:hypothetical protein
MVTNSKPKAIITAIALSHLGHSVNHHHPTTTAAAAAATTTASRGDK